MKRVIKAIPLSQGVLYALSHTNRYILAECDASVELTEEVEHIPVLGRGRVVKRRFITLLLTFHHKPNPMVDLCGIESIGFKGECLRSDGSLEVIDLTRCILISDLDLTEAGECRFEVECSGALLKKLRAF